MARAWPELIDDAVELRHALHRQPELTWSEHRTAETLRGLLDDVGIAWRPCAELGTVASLAADAPGRHVALRADMDAMPLVEATGLPHASDAPGVMHACGHDGHMAALVATTWWLRQHEDRLPGPVSLFFQPAEEGGHGPGAMIDDGALDGVDVIFGWHNWPAIPLGHAVCPDGPVMSANGTFEIVVRGAGGHASQPESTRDPVLAASAITVALQQLVSRRVAPQRAAVVAVTSIDAPSSSPTVTPDIATLGGSIRVADTAQRDEVFRQIGEVASATGTAYGVEVAFHPEARYGATVNHPGPAAEMRTVLEKHLGADWSGAEVLVPIMASEDFSYYLDEVPGAFALVGAGDGAGHDEPCHSARYDFNDRLLDPVARVFTHLAGGPLAPVS